MNCRKAEKLISKQLDIRLEASESAWLNAHLKICPACAHLALEYQKLKNLSAELRIEAEPSPYFSERVSARLSSEAKLSIWQLLKSGMPGPFLSSWLRLPCWLACCSLCNQRSQS